MARNQWPRITPEQVFQCLKIITGQIAQAVEIGQINQVNFIRPGKSMSQIGG